MTAVPCDVLPQRGSSASGRVGRSAARAGGCSAVEQLIRFKGLYGFRESLDSRLEVRHPQRRAFG
jgi:hypothetical protein